MEGGHAGAILIQGRIAAPIIDLPDGRAKIRSLHCPQADAQAHAFRWSHDLIKGWCLENLHHIMPHDTRFPVRTCALPLAP